MLDSLQGWYKTSKYFQIGTMLFCSAVLAALILLLPSPQFDLDNYRYTLSASLQSQAAIFALIVSSGVLLVQLSGDTSPKSLRYFPIQHLVSLLLMLSLLMFADGLSLLYLPGQVGLDISVLHLVLLHALLLCNGLVLVVVIAYVIAVVRWMRPESMMEAVVQDAARATTDGQRSEAIRTLEELTGKIIQKGYTGSIPAVLEGFHSISTHLPLQKSAQTAFRDVLRALERISSKLCNANLQSFIYELARVYAKLAGLASIYRAENQPPYYLDLQLSVRRVLSELVDRNLAETARDFCDEMEAAGKSHEPRGYALCLHSLLTAILPRPGLGELDFVLRAFCNLVKDHPQALLSELRQVRDLLRENKSHLTPFAITQLPVLSELHDRLIHKDVSRR